MGNYYLHKCWAEISIEPEQSGKWIGGAILSNRSSCTLQKILQMFEVLHDSVAEHMLSQLQILLPWLFNIYRSVSMDKCSQIHQRAMQQTSIMRCDHTVISVSKASLHIHWKNRYINALIHIFRINRRHRWSIEPRNIFVNWTPFLFQSLQTCFQFPSNGH